MTAPATQSLLLRHPTALCYMSPISPSLACSRKASMLSSAAKEGEPPANFMSVEMTMLGSCATSRAALSHVNSAARNHLCQKSEDFGNLRPLLSNKRMLQGAPQQSVLNCARDDWQHGDSAAY